MYNNQLMKCILNYILILVFVTQACNVKNETKDKEYFKKKYEILKKYNYNKVNGWRFTSVHPTHKEPAKGFAVSSDSIFEGRFGIFKIDSIVTFSHISDSAKTHICEHFNIPNDSIESYLKNTMEFIFDLDIKQLVHFNDGIIFQIDNKKNIIFFFYNIEILPEKEDVFGKLTHIEGAWYYIKAEDNISQPR